MSHAFTALDDLALLALVVAHGLDSDLNARETDVLVDRVANAAPALEGHELSGDQLSEIVRRSVERYRSLSVHDLDDVVETTRDAWDEGTRARAFAALVAVAEADGVVHTMERTFLRHLGTAWRVAGASPPA